MEVYLDFAKGLAEEAGKIMLQYFRSDEVDTTWKEDKTPLTIADTKINNLVAESIKQKYPEHRLVGEEESIDVQSDYVWVCDPIDGTTPYSHNMPFATFNLALTHKGRVVVSVVLDPFNDRLYTAISGQGSYMNDTRLDIKKFQTSAELSRHAIDLEVWGGKFGSVFADPQITGDVLKVMDRGQYSIFSLISIAYSGVLIASGEMAAVIFSGKNPWDMAAAGLVIEEAGGVVTDLFGEPIKEFHKPMRGVLAGTPEAHSQLLKSLLPVFKKTEMA